MNFLHLCGVNTKLSAKQFYRACLAGKLSERDFEIDEKGKVQQKMMALPYLSDLLYHNCMIGDFIHSGVYIHADYFAGNTKATLSVGFRNGREIDFPVSLYHEDIKKLSHPTNKVLAIFRKEYNQKFYSKCTYISKGQDVNKLPMLNQVKDLIQLEGDNTMTTEKMLQLAQNAGFTKSTIINTEDLVFVPEYRKYCEENTCGNYGKNYACPPECGTPQEMKEKALQYRQAVVFYTTDTVKSAFDDAETSKKKKRHMYMAWDVVDEYRRQGIEGEQILAGSCCLCSTCKKASNEPCVHPERRANDMSSYCIDVTKLAELCNMDIAWKENEASYFSMYLFDKK